MNFVPAPMTSNEPRRIEAVKKLGVIGTEQSELFYVYAELALEITGFTAGTASLIDENIQHTISACGPNEMEQMVKENPQFPRSQSPCAYTILSSNPKIVPDCRELALCLYASLRTARQNKYRWHNALECKGKRAHFLGGVVHSVRSAFLVWRDHQWQQSGSYHSSRLL